MKLAEALAVARSNAGRSSPELRIHLACGFTASQLSTLTLAEAALRRPKRRVTCTIGPYGDLVEAIRCEKARAAHAVLVVVEWSDLDPRLGLRRFACVGHPVVAADVRETVDARLDLAADAILRQARLTPVVVALPSLPFPPVFLTPGRRIGREELQIRGRVLAFAERLADAVDVSVVHPDAFDANGTMRRRSAGNELGADVPFAPQHLSALADALVGLAFPAQRIKGVITDLDDTLWRGLVGEIGADRVSWDLNGHSQIHLIYQRLLGSLAEAGTLIAVVSKNDAATASRALARDDLGLDRERVFPVEIGWGPKSEAVARVLAIWNVAAEAVAFVDDSPSEVAEVQARFPGITGFVFPAMDEAAALSLIGRLRDLCGSDRVHDDDRLRLASVRRAESSASKPDERDADAWEGFLAGLDAVLRFDFAVAADDGRPLELVNKTNQFNLNGRRIEAADWRRDLAAPGRFTLAVGYSDKFGALGTISVVCGRIDGALCRVQTWVLSCRAFARRIEHATLVALAQQLDIETFEFEFDPTPSNAPARALFASLGLDITRDPLTVSAFDVLDRIPPLHHRRLP